MLLSIYPGIHYNALTLAFYNVEGEFFLIKKPMPFSIILAYI